MNTQINEKQFIKNIIEKVMQDVKNATHFSTESIESLVSYRANCFNGIYHYLETLDFSQHESISNKMQLMINERNKQFDLEGSGLKVNEQQFKINQFYKLCCDELLNIDIFKTNEKAIEQFIHFKLEQEEQQRRSKVEFNGQQHQSLMHTDVLWAGWECDYTAWIIQENGKNILLTSDHGEIKVTDKEFLQNKIKEYEKVIEKSKKMLEMLN